MFKILESNERVSVYDARIKYSGKQYILKDLDGVSDESTGIVHAICDEDGVEQLDKEYDKVYEEDPGRCALCGDSGEKIFLLIQMENK